MILWGDDMPVYFGHDRIDGVSVTFPGCSGSLTDTSDATLNSSAQLLKDVTAYSKGKKYIGDIPTRGAGDLVVSGASVSFPAGYYETSHNVSVDTASLSAPSIEVTAGGLITATVDQMVSGYIEAGSASKTMQLPTQDAKNITPSMSQQIAVVSGKYATGDIVVDAVQTETKSILANGTYTPSAGKFFSSVTVNVPSESIALQEKTITPNENTQTIGPDDGYDGLSLVTVSAIPNTYVGSGVPLKATASITPSTSSQIVVSAGTYVTGDITVAAMPTGSLSTPAVNASNGLVTASIATSGYLPVGTQATLQLSVKGAATITPGSSAQTISAGQFLTGVQTIQGDTNLVPENIIYGKSIFGVPGNVVIQKYYTGTSEPSSSLGNDGDIYLKE